MSTPPNDRNEHLDRLMIALRAYAASSRSHRAGSKPELGPSALTLVFDTETETGPGQPLRFGTYQVRSGDELHEAGLFYRPEVMSVDEIKLLAAYADEHDLTLRTQADFITAVFYGIGYDLRATIVGFNLPFDLSRLAIRHGSARGSMRGGFTFTLSTDKRLPAVRVKHLSRRASFIDFAAPFRQRAARSDRRRGWTRARRGYFLDVNTLAHAMLSRSFSLGTLAEHLGTATRKTATEEHGGPLTSDYIAYAVQDTQVTWECHVALTQRYADLQLTVPAHRVYSEASLGKGYLGAMGVRPWREVQLDAPPHIIGIIMSTFFGGRSEVRIRREVRQVVLCDFLSMYPTVCTLMGLWRFVIADGMTWHEDTEAVRALIESVTRDDLKRPNTWQRLATLVQIEPDGDVVPVRAGYPGSDAATIGLNHLTTSKPLWFTLADCITAKLLTGQIPRVLRALTFKAGKLQRGLRPVEINGDAEFRVRPNQDDFYCRLIELRQQVKQQRDAASGAERERLDAVQNALKIAANATSYGIYAEVNVTDVDEPRAVRVHTGSGESYEIATRKVEEPGRNFHPLVATLITGAARLMLALAESLVTDANLNWVFCDTDSMAIARPEDVDEAVFHTRVDDIVGWFSALNPYAFGGSVLKVEDVNADLKDSAVRARLFCYAVSAKRYVLFNVDKSGVPVLRKASAHGLGHLRPPYDEANPATGIPAPAVPLAKLGVALWQHDLWWLIARAALKGPVVQLPLDHHPAMQSAALSRYAATTPAIHRWFKRYNEGRSYDAQVRPFGFLNAFTAADDSVRPVAPFDRDPVRSAASAFDRNDGEPVAPVALVSYARVLAQYHLHAEAKFANGRPRDSGATHRRHVLTLGATHIGKEADRWEEQFFIGADTGAEVTYGGGPQDHASLVDELRRMKSAVGERRLADAIGFSRETLRNVLRDDDSRMSAHVRGILARELPRLWTEQRRREEERTRALAWIATESERDGPTAVARRIGYDPANLAAIRACRRLMPDKLLRIITMAMATASPGRTGA